MEGGPSSVAQSVAPPSNGSVGEYIRKKKVTAHPDSIKLLHSVYDALDKVVTSPEMTEAEKKFLLSNEVKKFKKLKKQILLAKKDVSGKTDTEPSERIKPAPRKEIKPQESDVKDSEQPDRATAKSAASEVSTVYYPEAFAFALEEIKKIIKAEFAALREELKSWRQG